ncbi:hypothetical protein [Hoeflea alexandrii]|uniref:hypothetical protein n=1 Tax=Hoeflea alexandrii TaxID=288436 RepID=UPI0022AFA77F|nr:hypothetical protein [Hoeflea alexandrii]MCZ4288080.1 hypothetical protein [Hoeflea alexandrii]
MQIDVLALVISVALFACLLALLIAFNWRKIEVSPTVIGVFLLPIVFYLILSGAISEFAGGGFSVKLHELSSKPVATKSIELGSIVGTKALNADIARSAFFQQAQRVIAIDADAWEKVPEDDRNARVLVLATSIYQSLLSGGFHGLIVLDDAHKPIGFFESSYFLDLVRLPLDGGAIDYKVKHLTITPDQIKARLQKTNFAVLMKNPRIRATREGNKIWLDYRSTLAELFAAVRKNRLDAVVLIDFRGAYVGVVSRDNLVDQILDELLGAGSTPATSETADLR